MRFGVQLLPQDVSWSAWRDAWLRVDELGYDTNWSYDHVHAPRGDPASPCFEGWVGMAALGALSRNARVGMAVSGVLYRNPALLVKMATTLDHVTGGKTIFGIGAGWHESEHEGYGWGFPPPGERVSRLAEALELTHALWSGGDPSQPVDYSGRYYALKRAYCNPAPLQKPHPPIMVAGSGPRIIGLVARYADWWDTWAPVSEASQRHDRLKAACQKIGRPVSEITWSVSTDMVCDNDAARLADRVDAAVGRGTRDPAVARSRMLVGGTEEVAEQVQAYADAGVDHLLLHVGSPYDMRGVETFAREVMPAFR